MPVARHFAKQLSGLSLAIAMALPAWHAHAGYPELGLVGLAVHQETGRNIYLAALRSAGGQSPQRFLLGDGTLVLEQRVVARRTSTRNLLGTLLLQSELATGNGPSTAATEFVTNLIGAVQGSLYAGDSLEIARLTSGEVVASLNDVELARSQDETVFDYLAAAWVSDGGPSRAFYDSLMSPTIDPALSTVYDANTPTPERLQTVASWQAEPEPEPEPQVEPAPETVVAAASPAIEQAEPVEPESGETVSMDLTEVSSGQGPAVANVSASATMPQRSTQGLALAEPQVPAPQQASDEAQSARPETAEPPAGDTGDETQPVQVAALSPIESDPLLASDVQAMDLTEYSRQLTDFNNHLLRKVYTRIEYPRAAVRRSIQGNLELDVTLAADGGLMEIEVARSSGYKMLDSAAMRAAREALQSASDINPVAVAEYGREDGRLVIPVPVSFRLQE